MELSVNNGLQPLTSWRFAHTRASVKVALPAINLIHINPVFPAVLLSRDPGVYTFVVLYLWPAAPTDFQTSFELRSQGSTLHRPKSCLRYGLRPPTSWRFTHTRLRGNQRLFPLGTPSRPATFSLFTKQ